MLTSLLVSASLLAQSTPSVHVVLQADDVLSNGSTVTGLIDSALSDTGSWAAVANTSNGYAVVRDGELVLAVGEMHRGELVTGIRTAELSRDGRLGVLYSVDNGSGGTESRLQVGPDMILQKGDPLPGPIGISGTVTGIIGFDFEGTGAAVAVSYGGVGGGGDALLVGSFAGGTFVPVGGWTAGDPIAGLSRGFDFYSNSVAYTPTNGFAATVFLDGAPAFDEGIVVDGQGIAEQGGPGLAPNSTWTFRATPRVAINDSGAWILSGTIELSNGNDVGVIYAGGTIVAIEGTTPNGILFDPVAPFTRAAVQLADDGEPIFVLPFTSGRQRLMAGQETLVETSVTMASGQLITDLSATSQDARLAASSDGDTIVLAGRAGGVTSLLLVERNVGAPVQCAATPNSTGQPGALDAIGSSIVQINDLTLRARSLPAQQFSLLVTSRNQAFTPNPGGSEGNLCLGAGIGRFNDLLAQSDAAGEVSFAIDLSAMPTLNAPITATAGQTWFFQAWHRDVAPGGAPSSNFTAAVAVEMR